MIETGLSRSELALPTRSAAPALSPCSGHKTWLHICLQASSPRLLRSVLLCSSSLALLTKLDMTLTSSGKRGWISIWFFISSLAVLWDAGFCFFRYVGGHGQRGHATKTNDGLSLPSAPLDVSLSLSRPRSMVGGDLHWIWKPYSLYMNVDYVSHEVYQIP